MDRQIRGRLAEQHAADYLCNRGYDLLDRNVYYREGELDIVARKDGWTVFVEVRSRSGSGYGTPEESVTPAKQEKLKTAALRYLQEKEIDTEWRIDVIAVDMSRSGTILRLAHLENAVTDF